MKIHIGCGPVYLEGYHNLDLDLPHHHLASQRPDLVERNQTTIDNYYIKPITKDQFMSGDFHKEEVVVDAYAGAHELTKQFVDGKQLPFQKVEEILAVQLFEHFPFKGGKDVLTHWFNVLEPGGFVRIHVPDVDGIIKQYQEDGDIHWMLRQIYGSQKNKFGLHHSGYTPDTLTELLKEVGFEDVEILDSINDYPAFGIRGFKK